MCSEQRHVAIVGGGVIGLFAAHYLAERGAQVSIIERDPSIGSGASRGNSGQLVMARPLPSPGMVKNGLRHMLSRSGAFYVAPLALASLTGFLSRFMLQSTSKRYYEGLEKLQVLNELTMPLLGDLAEHGVGEHLGDTGNLRVFADQQAAESDREAALARADLGVNEPPEEIMYGHDLRTYEPALGPASSFGYVQPGLRWGDPSRLMDQLVTVLKSNEVEMITDSLVTSVREDRAGVTVEHGGRQSRYSHVLLAAGPWTGYLLKQAGINVALNPGMGYSFTVRTSNTPAHLLALETAHVGVTPMGKNRLRIAGTLEFTGRDYGKVRERIRAIQRSTEPFLAGVDWASITDEWGAARPMTPDGLPYIGPLPNRPRTLVATGHNMLGLSLGPATGFKTAEMIFEPGADPRMRAFAVNRKVAF